MSSFSGARISEPNKSTNPLISESVIWNNKDIKIDGKPIYYPNYLKAEILFFYHLQIDNNNLLIRIFQSGQGFELRFLPTWELWT